MGMENGNMQRVNMVFDLTKAWEEWWVEVPDNFDFDNPDFNQIEFISMEECGCSSMEVVQVIDAAGDDIWSKDE